MLMRFLLPVAVALAAPSNATAAPHLPVCPPGSPAPPAAAPCAQFYLQGRAPVSATPPPATERVFCHSFYATSYSSVRRDPVWTSYRQTGEMSGQSDAFGRRSRTFAQQAGLGASQQGRDGDYTNTPYDRGHMTPDNDAPTCPTQADTYMVTNIVPQISLFNEGLWKRLEGAVHRLAISDSEVFIVTGPIFREPRDPMHGIAVPSALFKAIYVPSRGFALAFISTNENPTMCRIVAIAEVQRQTGLDVFPSLPAAAKTQLPTLPHGWGDFPAECRVAGNDP